MHNSIGVPMNAIRSRMVVSLTAIAVTWSVSSCGGDAPADSPFAVSDSAGVEIVSTDVPTWETEPGWQLGAEPTVQIGLLDGEAPYLFSDIAGVLRLEDGTLVVGDGQSRGIRFFDSSGSFTHAVGGEGEGPGEFSRLGWIALCGGELFSFDWSLNRVTTWSLTGEFGKTFFLHEPGSERGPYRSRCGPDGSFVVTGWGVRPPPPPAPAFEFFAQPAPVWRIFPDVTGSTELGEYISSERVLTLNENGAGGSGPHPFGRSVVFAQDEDNIYIGTSERLQIEVRSNDGALLRLVRGPDDDLVIDEEIIAQYRAAPVAVVDSSWRSRLDEGGMPMPPRLPAYTELLIDPEGNLWVERFSLPWAPENRWGVFSSSGEFYGHVRMPTGFQMMGVSEGFVFGVSRDELEVERVEVYALLK